MLDPVTAKFTTMTWHYAPKDLVALAELEARIGEAGRHRRLITYSDLVRDVQFNLPNLREGVRTIDIADWQDLDRAMLGDFLGYISMRSYEKAGFFSSALVVTKMDSSPGEGFYKLLIELGLIRNAKSDKAMYVWVDHVEKAYTWYSGHAD